MRCIRPDCEGKMKVSRSAIGNSIGFQERQCDVCHARKTYIIQEHEGQDGVRARLKRLDK